MAHSKGPAEEHLRCLTRVLSRLHKFGHTLYINNCSFSKSEAFFLGYLVSSDGYLPNLILVSGIEFLSVPKSIRTLQVALCMLQFQAKFIKDFALEVQVLRLALKKAPLTPNSTKLNLSSAAVDAFHSIKQKISKVILHKKKHYFPKWNRALWVECDASQYAAGGCAYQYDVEDRILKTRRHSHLIRPVAYISQALRYHEKRWFGPSGSLPENSSIAEELCNKFCHQDLTDREF